MSSTHTANLNQVDVMQVRAFIDRVGATPELAHRDPHVIARWVGGSRAKVTFGAASMYLGGDGDLNPMQALLGSLAACDVDLVAMHASLLDIEITELWVEAGGHFTLPATSAWTASIRPDTAISTTRCTFAFARHPRSRS
jgi:hypothetical protein